MKKIDTFFLSEKQLAQLRKFKTKPKMTKVIIAVLLLVISCISGIALNYVQDHTLEMILTGVVGFGGLGCVIVFMGAFSDKTGGSFNPEFEKEIEEARREEGYFGEK